jgi:prophage tail gpP-like protein
MSDAIRLEVNGRRIDHFLSYTVEADLYCADHAFSVEVANLDFDVITGSQCKLYVNDQLELTGIIDHKVQRTDKQGRRLCLEGRDLMGLVVDSYCEEFITVEGKKLSELAELLLKDVPFVNRQKILYQQDLVGKLKTRRSREQSYGLEAIMGAGEPERIAQIRPGMSKFQVLQMYALSRGQMFYSLPDGTFVFGRPMVGGDPEFEINFTIDGIGNNVLSAEVDENLSRRWSKVTVVGQQQAAAEDAMEVRKVNVSGTVTDPTFPFYKPFVQLSHNDSQTPKQHARLILEKMRYDGMRLSYDLPRHSQGGRNFAVNRLIRVMDSVHNIDGKPIDGVYLISGRTFRLDKENGPCTTLRLSPPGLVEDGSSKGAHR